MSDALFREHLLATFPQTCLGLRRKLWSLEQFAKYAAGRARLAGEYARGLERLGQKTAATANVFFEESGVTLLWAQVQDAEAGFARAQTALAAALQERVADQLALVKATTEGLLRNIEAEGAAAARALADAQALAARAQDAYQRASAELEAEEWKQAHHQGGSSDGSNGSSGKSKDKEMEAAQKREKRMAKARAEAEAAEAQCRAAVAGAAGAQGAYYGAQLPRLLDALEAVYTQRATTIHAALAEYGAAALAAARAAVPLYEGVVGAAARFAPRREVEEYVARTEQYFAPPAPPAFVPFVRTPPGRVPPLVAQHQNTWAGKLHTKISAAIAASGSSISGVSSKKSSSGSGASSNGSNGSFGSSNKSDQDTNCSNNSNAPKGQLLGRDLSYVMSIQAERYPGLKVPHAYVWLAGEVLRLGGAKTEGVFRVSGALPAIEAAKRRIDAGERPPLRDVHDASCLLKFFLRSLPDALVPTARYGAAVAEAPAAHDVFGALPEPNRTVAGFVLRYLREHFLAPDVVAATHMGLENLITVFVPCFLRSPTADLAEFIKHGEHERVWLRKGLVALDLSPYPSLESCLQIIAAADAGTSDVPPVAAAPPAAPPAAAPPAVPPPPVPRQTLPPPPPPPRRRPLPQSAPVPAPPAAVETGEEEVVEAEVEQQEEQHEEQEHVSLPPRKPLPCPVPVSPTTAVGTPEGSHEEEEPQEEHDESQ